MNVALITVGGTLGGALLTFVGTLVSQYVTGRREDKRREHERDIKTMELEDSRLERRRNERLSAYQKFYVTMHSITFFIGPKAQEKANSELRTQIMQEAALANTEIELVGTPAVVEAANATECCYDSG